VHRISALFAFPFETIQPFFGLAAKPFFRPPHHRTIGACLSATSLLCSPSLPLFRGNLRTHMFHDF
jgi:hypothetical protein